MNKIPKEITAFFEKNEGKVFLNYLRLLTEKEQDQYLKVCKTYKSWEPGIPFAVTRLGEILAWTDDGYIMMYKFYENSVRVILQGCEYFETFMNSSSVQNDYFELELNNEALKKFGNITSSECFIFEPIIALGGNKSINNIQKGDTLTYIALCINFIN